MSESVRRTTFRISQIEGMLFALMVGSTEPFALFYAVKRGIHDFQLALLTTGPVLLGALANWLIPSLISKTQVKFALMVSVVLQIIGLAGLVVSVHQENFFIWIFASLSFYWVGGLMAGPFWLDWMSPWLPAERLGRYFSRRNGLIALATVSAFLLWAYFLYDSVDLRFFQMAFLSALIVRIISFVLLWVQVSPPVRRTVKTAHVDDAKKSHAHSHQHPAHLSLFWKSTPLLYLLIFTVLFRFVVNLASPFFIDYMITDLKFSLMDYAIISSVPFFARALFLASWGEATRHFRPFVGLQIAMVMIAVSCFFWSQFRTVPMISAIEVISGIFWGGFELSCVLILQMIAPGNARALIGFHVALMSLSSALGALTGSYMQKIGIPFEIVIQISAGLRFAVGAAFFFATPRLPEARASIKVYGEFLTSALSIRPSLANIGRLIPFKKRF